MVHPKQHSRADPEDWSGGWGRQVREHNNTQGGGKKKCPKAGNGFEPGWAPRTAEPERVCRMICIGADSDEPARFDLT